MDPTGSRPAWLNFASICSGSPKNSFVSCLLRMPRCCLMYIAAQALGSKSVRWIHIVKSCSKGSLRRACRKTVLVGVGLCCVKVDSVGALGHGDIGLALSSCSMGVVHSASSFILTFYCVSCKRFLRTGLGETFKPNAVAGSCHCVPLSLPLFL